MSSTRSGRMVLALCTLAVLAVGACREEEQNRILMQQKGVYQGQPDQSLSETQVRELQFRAGQQSF